MHTKLSLTAAPPQICSKDRLRLRPQIISTYITRVHPGYYDWILHPLAPAHTGAPPRS